MPPPAYVTSCPECGAELTPHAGLPDSAPWLCSNCLPNRGWFVVELKPEARKMWDRRAKDHGQTPAARVLYADRLAERDAARVRGTSALPEHLSLLSADSLSQLQRLILHPDFANEVAKALKARG